MNINLNYTAVVAVFAIILFSNTAFAQKANIKNSNPINNSLSYVTRLEPIMFEYKNGDSKTVESQKGLIYGFNAKQLQEILPGIVKTRYKMVPAGKNNFKTVASEEVDLESLIPLLVGSIKEQQTEIEKLKAEMQALKQQVKK